MQWAVTAWGSPIKRKSFSGSEEEVRIGLPLDVIDFESRAQNFARLFEIRRHVANSEKRAAVDLR